MNYFQAYLPSLDEAVVAAWDSQIAEAAETPWLAQALAAKSAELFPRFASSYARLRALPRGARRALQRRLALSGECAIPVEWRRRLAGSLAGAALLLAFGQEAQAAIINVTTNKLNRDNDGLCSLIEAIENANDTTGMPPHANCAAGDPAGADEIVLPPGRVHALTKSKNSTDAKTGLPEITSAITISGNGSTIKRKKNGNKYRIFKVGSGGNLTLENVTVSSGDTPSNSDGGGILSGGTLTIRNSTISGNKGYLGGAVYVSGGSLTIENSTIEKNFANSGGGIAAFNFDTLSIENSTIAGNRSRFHGGGVSAGAGDFTLETSTVSHNKAGYPGGGISILSGGTLTVENSTLSGNVSRKKGGGLFNGGGAVTLNNSTISGNRSQAGGGGIYSNGDLYLNRSLISGNKAPTGREVYDNSNGAITAANYNIFGVSNNHGLVGFSPGATDIVPPESLGQIIGPLANNGGPTYTHALVTGSPAIDAAPLSGCPATDQRGAPYSRPAGPLCDIGAFEKQ